ncbi:hypothetical protein AVEN_223308-1 [Araneus ventricosus]|uniref:Uncharacterized protein n=1 Tax=Araneus ventricosus TaxID=182803 RepID=A0A4Y2G9Q4_ARAVE|nr:hypothetical protein AVEN_223308-1 [Araneus ventricosus]
MRKWTIAPHITCPVGSMAIQDCQNTMATIGNEKDQIVQQFLRDLLPLLLEELDIFETSFRQEMATMRARLLDVAKRKKEEQYRTARAPEKEPGWKSVREHLHELARMGSKQGSSEVGQWNVELRFRIRILPPILREGSNVDIKISFGTKES